MKVVLFCGGQGMRLREYSQSVPKPMVTIGYRPLLWHVMKYYAHYGHRDFILCLGYQADTIKNYFLNYNECLSNDFVLSNGGKQLHLLNSDIQDWNITFVDTGLTANVGQRLKAVEPYLRGEEIFMANYSDGLTDFPLPELIEHHRRRNKVGNFLCVKPPQTFHLATFGDDDVVINLQHVETSDLRINGGYFIFTKEIFQYIDDEDDLVEGPLQRLAVLGKLTAIRYDGFWACVDTFKERQLVEDLYAHDEAPWEVWKKDRKLLYERRTTVPKKIRNGRPLEKEQILA
jgi:glucose-1-phosphate cytidylyltransferase